MLHANGQGGSSATVLAAHFAKQNTKFGGGKTKKHPTMECFFATYNLAPGVEFPPRADKLPPTTK